MSREPRPGDVSDKARIELAPIATRLHEQIDIGERDWDLVARALAQALMAGVRIGGAEVAAQAIESGLPVTLNMHIESLESGED